MRNVWGVLKGIRAYQIEERQNRIVWIIMWTNILHTFSVYRIAETDVHVGDISVFLIEFESRGILK